MLTRACDVCFKHGLLPFLLVAIGVSSACGQGPLLMTQTDVQQHTVLQAAPVYPAIAAAARIEGDVQVAVTINAGGKVTSVSALSGPPMLRGAALNAVKQWQFSPFTINGSPSEVAAIVIVPFHLEKKGPQPSAEQEKAAQAWFPLSDGCRASLQAHKAEEAVSDCKSALDMSLKAGELSSGDQLARNESQESYGRALLLAGDFLAALTQENDAVDTAKKYRKNTDQEYAMPFYWRAVVEIRMERMDAAHDFAART